MKLVFLLLSAALLTIEVSGWRVDVFKKRRPGLPWDKKLASDKEQSKRCTDMQATITNSCEDVPAGQGIACVPNTDGSIGVRPMVKKLSAESLKIADQVNLRTL